MYTLKADFFNQTSFYSILFKKNHIARTIIMSRFLLVLLVLVSVNTFAAVSKWVDSQGQVHYSDELPPTEMKAETLRSTSDTEGTVATKAPAAPKTIAEREAEMKKSQQAKKETADKAAQKQAAADALKANCDNAQQNLSALQSGVRMMEVNAKGENVFIDDKQRQQRLEKSQQDISRYCK
jgi:hypothetical protein